VDSPFQRLLEREAGFGKTFPKRLVGEFTLSEVDFRALLADLREMSSLRRPPRLLPRVVIVTMVFTARYDYKGAFWRAFQDNLQEEELDQAAWGDFFRRTLQQLDLFSPPAHWMVNVFPVLYHAIVPEAAMADFGIMVRSLVDAIDVRDLDDEELLRTIESYDLPLSLRLFVASKDSASVACDLVRQIAEDFRQLPERNYDKVDASSFRGALLSSVCQITPEAKHRFRLQARPMVWRWDFGTGEIGAVLTGNLSFEELPLRLRFGTRLYRIESFSGDSGRWSVTPRIVSVPTSMAGTDGYFDLADGNVENVRLAKLDSLPLFFKSAGNYGTFVSSRSLESGVYGVV
jgi:hypothetical protein